MKSMKQLFGTLAVLTGLMISPAYASLTHDDDTLRIVVDGDTVSTIDMSHMEEMQELENMPDMDSIMKIVEEAMEEVDAAMQDIRIEEKGDQKVITITDKDGKVVQKMRIDDEELEKDEKEIKFEFEKDDSDKMIHNYIALDLGMNNYLENGAFPSGDANYYVKPFGSWNVALELGMRAYATSWLSFDMGLDLMWYNFKLQNKSVVTGESGDEENPVITYTENPEYNAEGNNAIRSKLTTTYLDLNFMPVFHVGKEKSGINKRPVRFGVGGFAGYRIGAHTKNVWEESGQKRKVKNHDNFYLNSFRYGVKAMIGIKEMNFFMNYDLNTLFEKDKGPGGNNLNAFAFGVRFII